MVTIASRGGKRFRVFNEVAPTMRVCVQKPIILPEVPLFSTAQAFRSFVEMFCCFFSLLRRMSLPRPPGKSFNSWLTISGTLLLILSGQGKKHRLQNVPPVVRLLAVSPSLAVKKTSLQVNMLWFPTKQKIDSFRGPKHLMWVTTTCSTGRGEGQAGCDWQSDAPPLSFISNLSNSWNTGFIFYFTPGHCKLASAFDSFSHFFPHSFCRWHRATCL